MASKAKPLLAALWILTVFCVFLCPLPAFAQAAEPAMQMLLVADISNSMNEIDANHYLTDALKLAVDLAPNGAQAALITVNDSIAYESGLTDISAPQDRKSLKQAMDAIHYSGNTNLAAGIQRAVEMLNEAPEKSPSQRILLMSDISEGGLYLGESMDTDAYKAQLSILNESAGLAKENGIVIDTLLLGSAPDNDPGLAAVENLSAHTGGQVKGLLSAHELPPSVENLFFEAFTYNRSTVFSVNSIGSQQSIRVDMPTLYVNRARVLISATTPVEGIQATQKGDALNPETNKSYSMLDIARPSEASIEIVCAAGSSGNVTAYLIADYSLELRVQAKSIPDPSSGTAPQQTCELQADIIDTVSGKSILSKTVWDQFEHTFVFTEPNGSALTPLDVNYRPENGIILRYRPQSFGDYELHAALHQGEMALAPDAVTVQVADAFATAGTKEPGWNLTLLVAGIIGGSIILATLLLVIFRKRPKPAATTETVKEIHHEFVGKFDIFVIMARGGEYEFPPMSFRMDRLQGRKKASLADIFAGCNMPLTFPGADKIWLMPGPQKSVLLKNASKAEIRCLGRVVGVGATEKLQFAQKFYITFEQGEDEVEIHYRDTKETLREGGTIRKSYQT